MRPTRPSYTLFLAILDLGILPVQHIGVSLEGWVEWMPNGIVCGVHHLIGCVCMFSVATLSVLLLMHVLESQCTPLLIF